MSEEEYEAELAAESAAKASRMEAGEKEQEENLLSDAEAAAISAKISNYAPWMTVDPQAIARAKKEREDRKKKSAMQSVDTLRIDPQAAETGAAAGLRSKVVSEDEVQLNWETNDE